VFIKNLKKNYSIFLRKTCFGREDSFFLLLPGALPATAVALRGLLWTPSTGLAKGEISRIFTGGGDQLSSSLLLLACFVFAVLVVFTFGLLTVSINGALSFSSSPALDVLDVVFRLVRDAGGEKTNREGISETNSCSCAGASIFFPLSVS